MDSKKSVFRIDKIVTGTGTDTDILYDLPFIFPILFDFHMPDMIPNKIYQISRNCKRKRAYALYPDAFICVLRRTRYVFFRHSYARKNDRKRFVS